MEYVIPRPLSRAQRAILLTARQQLRQFDALCVRCAEKCTQLSGRLTTPDEIKHLAVLACLSLAGTLVSAYFGSGSGSVMRHIL